MMNGGDGAMGVGWRVYVSNDEVWLNQTTTAAGAHARGLSVGLVDVYSLMFTLPSLSLSLCVYVCVSIARSSSWLVGKRW